MWTLWEWEQKENEHKIKKKIKLAKKKSLGFCLVINWWNSICYYESHKTKIVISPAHSISLLKGHPEINWSGFHVFFFWWGGKTLWTLRVFCSKFVDIFLRIICLLHVPPHTSFHLRSLQWNDKAENICSPVVGITFFVSDSDLL